MTPGELPIWLEPSVLQAEAVTYIVTATIFGVLMATVGPAGRSYERILFLAFTWPVSAPVILVKAILKD